VAAHEGSPADFLRRHELEATAATRRDGKAKEQFLATLLQRPAGPRNLRQAWDYLAIHGGQAPGPDGLRYDDLDDGEVWALLRCLERAILDDTYRPGPDRELEIPKVGKTGTRALRLSSVVDRVVQRAIVQTVQPYLDPQFDDCSFGYRPGRDRQHALARAEQLATSSGGWVWLTEDLRDAFDHVPQQRLLDVVRLRLGNNGIVRLIETVVLTGKGQGLRQGGCLSPLLLNLYLDHLLDRKWRRRHPDLSLLRVADDLLVLTRTGEEARQAWTDLKTLLRPTGLAPKGTPSSAVRDLSGGDHPTGWGTGCHAGRPAWEYKSRRSPGTSYGPTWNWPTPSLTRR
jgi:CRISPR-associated protein Cas1